MLIEFYGQNFGCFKDEFRLSMLATNIDPQSNRGIIEVPIEGEDEPLRLLRSVAIYGPNASGKTTVLLAAGTLRLIINHDRASGEPFYYYNPFILCNNNDSPVRLGIQAVINHQIYDYEIQYSIREVVKETLRVLEPSRPRILLDRKKQQVEGEWLSDPQFELITKNFRPNALLLTLADKFAPGSAKNIVSSITSFLISIPIRFLSEFNQNSKKRIYADPSYRKWLLNRMPSADFNVVDILAVENKNENIRSGEEKPKEQNDYRLTLIHKTQSGDFPIPYELESEGTRTLLEFSPILYDLVHSDIPLAFFFDEIERSLHPTLLREMLDNFNCQIPMDKVCGQLIFSTHQTSLIDAEAKNAVFRRDQVYLTDKDASGAARLYSVAEFKERNNLNIKKRYLEGRYGAIPSVGPFSE